MLTTGVFPMEKDLDWGKKSAYRLMLLIWGLLIGRVNCMPFYRTEQQLAFDLRIA